MTYTKNEVLIDVKDVSLSYDKQILRDINFVVQNIVRPGGHVAVVGVHGHSVDLQLQNLWIEAYEIFGNAAKDKVMKVILQA